MARIRIEPINQETDAVFRKILREITPEGKIRISYEREPSFFDSCRVEGTEVEAAYAKDLDNEKYVGIGVRAIKPCYIKQEIQRMGYLSNLRIQPSHRNSFALIRIFQYLKELHQKSKLNWDIMMVTGGNETVEKLLTSNRAGLPKAYPLGRYYTFTIGVKDAGKRKKSSAFEIRSLKSSELNQWFNFLNETAPRQSELFPAYHASHLDPDQGLLRGLNPENIYVALENEEIIGAVSARDQRSFKQYYIEGYAPAIHFARPIYNTYAHIVGRPILPAVGEELRSAFLATICIKDDRQEVFEKLLQTVRSELYKKGGYHSLLVGFHTSDPLKRVAEKIPHIPYQSNAWMISWEDMAEQADYLKKSRIHLELGAL
jgi:hypothetical protein